MIRNLSDSLVYDDSPSLAGELFRATWLGRRRLALMVLFGGLLGVAYWQLGPREYESEAHVLVLSKRPNMVAEGGLAPAHFDDYVAVHRVLIESPLIIEQAIREHRLHDLASLQHSGASNVETIIEGLTIRRGHRDLGTHSDNMVTLTYRSTVAEDCQQIIDAVLACYLKFLHDTFQNLSGSTVQLMTTERDALRDELAKQEADYRTFRATSPMLWQGTEELNPRRSRLVKIESQRSALLLRRSQLELQRKSLTEAIARGRGGDEIAQLVYELASKAAPEDSGSSTSVSLPAQLLPLVIEQQRLPKEFGPNHPQMISIRRRIDAVRRFFSVPLATSSRRLETAQTDDGNDAELPDLGSTYLAYLEQELEHNHDEERSLDTFFEQEMTAARLLTRYQLQDDEFRTSMTRTREQYDHVRKRVQDAQLVQSYGGYEARVIAPAQMGKKVAPSLLRSLLLGLICGALAGVAWVCPAALSTHLGEKVQATA